MNNEDGWCMESAQANAGIVRGGVSVFERKP